MSKKKKRKLTAAQKREKKERRKKFMTIFVHGKKKKVPRPEMIDGLPVDEFIANNADPIWLHENEMWELIEVETESPFLDRRAEPLGSSIDVDPDEELPF